MTAFAQNQGSNGANDPQTAQEQQLRDQATVQGLLAIINSFNAGSTSTVPGGMDQAANAALHFAQALVILDPSLAQGGTPLAHDLALKVQEGQNALAVTQAQADAQVAQEKIRGDAAVKAAAAAPTQVVAAAPTPAKQAGVKGPTP